MSKMNNFFNMLKENKKLLYAVNIFILLILVSLILKFDTSKLINKSSEDTSNSKILKSNQTTNDSYVYSLEKRIEKIISKIEGVDNVNVMIYTKNTPELKPVYDENVSNETNTEMGSDGIKREEKREAKQNKVILGNNNNIVEKFYQYPEISGVLVVVDYTGNKDIYSILMNSIKTLFDINLNDIQIVLSN